MEATSIKIGDDTVIIGRERSYDEGSTIINEGDKIFATKVRKDKVGEIATTRINAEGTSSYEITSKGVTIQIGGKQVTFRRIKNGNVAFKIKGCEDEIILTEDPKEEGKTILRFGEKFIVPNTRANWEHIQQAERGLVAFEGNVEEEKGRIIKTVVSAERRVIPEGVTISVKSRLVEEQTRITDAPELHPSPIWVLTFKKVKTNTKGEIVHEYERDSRGSSRGTRQRCGNQAESDVAERKDQHDSKGEDEAGHSACWTIADEKGHAKDEGDLNQCCKHV